MYIVAGLGNPGDKYLKNLHNLGFMAVELLAEKHGVSFDKKGFKGLFGVKNIGGEKVIFLKPQTFMNLSGECIREISAYFKVPSENILVIYDDIDLPKGALRVREKGSAGTHNGMRNIIAEIKTENFRRIRIGTGRPPENVPLADYVLSDVPKAERPLIAKAIESAADEAEKFLGSKS